MKEEGCGTFEEAIECAAKKLNIEQDKIALVIENERCSSSQIRQLFEEGTSINSSKTKGLDQILNKMTVEGREQFYK